MSRNLIIGSRSRRRRVTVRIVKEILDQGRIGWPLKPPSKNSGEKPPGDRPEPTPPPWKKKRTPAVRIPAVKVPTARIRDLKIKDRAGWP